VKLPDSEFRSARIYAWLMLSITASGCSSSSSAGNVGDGSGGVTASSGGNAGTGGASKSDAGGSNGSGGTSATGRASGGSTGPSTTNPAGGATSLGGQSSSGGMPNTGGLAPTGGRSSTGGSPAAGGTLAAGGKSTVGGAPGTGGAISTGGASVTGGMSATGGAIATGGNGTGGAPTITRPCDIYATGNTPCVAAHSTVRALFGAYAGNLYQVKRRSDNTTKDIPVLAPGGFADSALQDTFCQGTTCDISIIYDQSAKGNHLTPAPGGGANKTADKPVVANKLKLTVGGHTVYGAYFEGGMGYRNNKTTGIPTGELPGSMYMVASGKHYNNQCCFDYGNAETTNNDDGEGTMEALYFGNNTGWGKGAGSGPWIMADIENGLWSGNVTPNNNAPSITFDYVTGVVKGKPGTFAIKSGNAQSGILKTSHEGTRPAKGAWNLPYEPMRKQGAIILGIGGDNSNWAVGTFFEGCMTTGYSTNAIDDAIQANIVAAGYGT